MRLIGLGFALLALYLLAQSTLVLSAGFHPHHSTLGIVWTALTATVMFALAAGKARTGAALDNLVLTAEGRVTLIDGLLAAAVLLGLVLSRHWAGGGPTPTGWLRPRLLRRARRRRSSSASTAECPTAHLLWPGSVGVSNSR